MNSERPIEEMKQQSKKGPNKKGISVIGALTIGATFPVALPANTTAAERINHSPKMTVEEVAKSFGPDVTAKDIERLFAEVPPVGGIIVMECCKLDR